MKARMLTAAIAALVMSVSLSGCITVHGERVKLPATTKAEAAKVLKSFTDINNRSNEDMDAKLNRTIETGPLGAIDQAGLRAQKKVHPEGNPNYTPLEFSDTRFLIPQQAGWPKFFVADTLSNREDRRWLIVFTRDSVDARWKATYLASLSESELPTFTRDEKGYVEAVPLNESSELALAPERLSRAYTTYLKDGKGRDFAPGPLTSELREKRQKDARTPKVWNDYLDQPADKGPFAPLGLRTSDGGAMVFFSTYHHHKQTAAKGLKPPLPDNVYKRAMITGTPEHAITYTYVAQQAVSVPRKGGQVRFLYQMQGITAAKAE